MKIKIRAKDKKDIPKLRALLSMQLAQLGVKNIVFVEPDKKIR